MTLEKDHHKARREASLLKDQHPLQTLPSHLWVKCGVGTSLLHPRGFSMEFLWNFVLFVVLPRLGRKEERNHLTPSYSFSFITPGNISFTLSRRIPNSWRKKTSRDEMIQKIPLLHTAVHMTSFRALPSPIGILGIQSLGGLCGWFTGWDDKCPFLWLGNHPMLSIKQWMLDKGGLKASLTSVAVGKEVQGLFPPGC